MLRYLELHAGHCTYIINTLGSYTELPQVKFENACCDYATVVTLDEFEHNEFHSFGDALHIDNVRDVGRL